MAIGVEAAERLGTRAARPGTGAIEGRWLGRVEYRAAWDMQHELVRRRADGEITDQLLMLEHAPVLTLGRQSDPRYVRASTAELKKAGIEVIRVERGGEVTYHGPGQLVAYPIIRLADRQILLRPFVRALEQAMIDTAAHFGVPAGRREGYPGVWCATDRPRAGHTDQPATQTNEPPTHADQPRKIGALGLRIERGTSYHGIALNITTDLAAFDLIDPCGLPDASVTSIAREAGWPADRSVPNTQSVEEAAQVFETALGRALGIAATGGFGATGGFAATDADGGFADTGS